jgi:hypothetical protein
MRGKKYCFKGLVLLGLALLLSACDNTKYSNIIFNTEIDSPTVGPGGKFSIVTLPSGFIVAPNPTDAPTPISYSVSISGGTSNTCDVSTFTTDGGFEVEKPLSGTTYALSDHVFLNIVACTAGTKVYLNIAYQIGTQKYEGNTSFTAT